MTSNWDAYWEQETEEDDPLDDYCPSCGLDLHGGPCWGPEFLDPTTPPAGPLVSGYEWYWMAEHCTPHWDFRYVGASA